MQYIMRGRSSSFASFAVVVSIGIAVGCSSKDDEPRNNGVNDVKKACELRATWTRAATEKCINCVTAAPAPKCDCEAFKEFGGLCEAQEADRRSDPGCTSALDDCTRACNKTDCGCVEGCYAQADRCKQLSGARDGCVADACAQYCQ